MITFPIYIQGVPFQTTYLISREQNKIRISFLRLVWCWGRHRPIKMSFL